MDKSQQKQIKEAVRRHYAELARTGSSACCGPDSNRVPTQSVAEMIGYAQHELSSLPEDVAGSSLGCGNPIALSEIHPGEVVLDLGSGAGLDVILAAQRVGETGRVIGLDMTPDMIERSTRSAETAGVDHIVEFRLGEMEDMPVDNDSVDLVVSNCVVNLSPDKEKVFQEAYRVLRPGGRMFISDIVTSQPLPEDIRHDLSSWTGCVAGALEESEYLNIIKKAGFEDIAVIDKVDATRAELGTACCEGSGDAPMPLSIYSIKVGARKGVR